MEVQQTPFHQNPASDVMGQSLATPTEMVASAFDLGSIDTREACNKPFDLELVHPVTKVGTGVFIRIVGKDSDAYRKVIEGIANEELSRAAIRRSKMQIPDTITKLEAKNINGLVAATIGWYTLSPVRNEQSVVIRHDRTEAIVINGNVIPFNIENARELYTKILPARDQVQEGLNDLENFMPK